MNQIKLLLTTALLGSLLAAPTFAVVSQQEASVSSPKPIEVVNPTEIPSRFLGKTVKITFTLDETGRPHDIKLADYFHESDLARSLLPAVAQWKFTPIEKDGRPVSHRVMLPITLLAQD